MCECFEIEIQVLRDGGLSSLSGTAWNESVLVHALIQHFVVVVTATRSPCNGNHFLVIDNNIVLVIIM